MVSGRPTITGSSGRTKGTARKIASQSPAAFSCTA
jgi:hypothetical protein